MLVSHISTQKLKDKWFPIIFKSKDGVKIRIGRRTNLFECNWEEFKDAFERNPENPNLVKFKEVKLAKIDRINCLLASLAIQVAMPNLGTNELSKYLIIQKEFKELLELTEVSSPELVKVLQNKVQYIKRRREELLLDELIGTKKSKGVHKYDGGKRQDTQNVKNGREMGTEGFSLKAILSKKEG